MRYIFLFFVSICLLPLSLRGQDSDIGNWFIYFGNYSVNERWAIHGEIQYRNYNFAGDLEQLLTRGGLQYKLKNTASKATLGYGYILSEPYIGEDEKRSINEHRIYQEFLSKQQWGKRVNVAHRYRFEQRFIDQADDLRLRFRYFLAINIPFNQVGMKQHAIYASLYNEIFLNGQDELFDRNRIYGGLGYALKDNLRVQLGYMVQVYQGDSRGQTNISIHHNF